MKYFKQFSIIMLITFLGELLNRFIPLPIPASVYGLILMYIALLTKVIKLSDVQETGKFFVEIMPVMFVPAGVGLMESWGIIKPMFAPVAVITVVTTVIVMGVTGVVTQIITGKDDGGE